MKARMNEKGFTLIEMLVAIAISGIVMAGIYSAYYSQQKSSVKQQQLVQMQQSIRAGMWFMEKEIRKAGYDPLHSAGAAITTAEPDQLKFTFLAVEDGEDNDGDGETDESKELKKITFSLYDSGSDGDDDLGIKVGSGSNRPLALNIDALDFVYLDEDGTRLDDDGAGGVVASIPDIRSIQVTMVARTEKEDRGYTNNTTYENQQGEDIFTASDYYRRQLLTCEIKGRNLGLQK